MAKRLKALNISVPQWMKDFMKDNNMSPSRIVQDAVLAEHKRQLDEKWLLESRLDRYLITTNLNLERG